MGEGLRQAGVRFDLEPEGTFYWWGDVSGLPAPINEGMAIFRAAAGPKQLLVVPGAGHVAAYNTANGRYERTVLDFLARSL